jgi:uncharacterized protein (DUF302 family)
MSLVIDPSVIDPDDIGAKQTELSMTHEEAIAHVRAVCEDVGFGIPVEFSPSELLNEKVDADRDPYYVLGACNPGVANRALNETFEIGALFPCNMVIWQTESEKQVVYHVSIMKIARLLGMAPDSAAWEAIIADTGELVDEAFSRLEDN